MILADTSVWVDHLRRGDERLADLLTTNQISMHPFVLGELACGNLAHRSALLQDFGRLPRAKVANDTEVLYFIEKHRLMGRGVGYLDMHLLASCALEGKALL